MYPNLSGENVLLTFVCSSFGVVKSVWCYSKKILWVNSPYLLLSWFKFLRIDLEVIVKGYQSTFFGFVFSILRSSFEKIRFSNLPVHWFRNWIEIKLFPPIIFGFEKDFLSDTFRWIKHYLIVNRIIFWVFNSQRLGWSLIAKLAIILGEFRDISNQSILSIN